MYRVLIFCAMMVMNVESFINRTRTVKMAVELFDSHLVEKEYTKLDKDLTYLLLVGAIYYPAHVVATSTSNVPLNVTQLYHNSLHDILAQVQLDPNKTVKELKDMLKKTTQALVPLTTVIHGQCASLSDHECNELIRGLLASGLHPDLEKSVSVLDKAHQSTKVFLERNPELEKLAESLNYMPYLQTNPDVEAHVLALADWLKAILPK